MEKIELKLDEIKSVIADFYDYKQWYLTTVNGLDLGDQYEIQWIFCSYTEKNVVKMFYAQAGYEEAIPTIRDIIPSAWVPEAEVHDLLGAKIEQAQPGLFLEPDMEKAPLRKSQ